jgi:polyhydroxybutyrate depolymerase
MKQNTLVRLLCLLAACLSLTAYASAPKVCEPHTLCTDSIAWQGEQRTFSYYLPNHYTDLYRYDNLVIALHGTGSSGYGLSETILQGSFNRIADKSHTIVVYPDAINGTWNNGTENTAKTIDDVGFIRAIMAFFEKYYYINPNRIYVIGMSSGGMMAYRLACESADKVTAVAVIAASMPTALVSTCKPARHIPILMVNGTRDPMMPWNGRQVLSVTGSERGAKLTVPETFEAWRNINNIHTAINQHPYAKTSSDGTWVWVTEAKGFDNTDMVLYTIYGGGHAWPGGAQYLPTDYIGNVSHDLDGSEIVWQFLISHRLVPLPPILKSKPF